MRRAVRGAHIGSLLVLAGLGAGQTQIHADAPVLVETGGTFAPDNLAAGKTAFAQDVIDAAPHAIANVNDGVYGNANSWIAGGADSFVGINLGSSPITISRVAFGRDNPGSFGDRTDGTYTLQFTTTPDPDAATPDGDWTTIGIIAYPGTLTSPGLRHRYSFAPVQATGFRIKVQTDSFPIGIDELELYDYDPVPHIAVEQPTGTSLLPATTSILFGSGNLNTPGAPKTFTLKNTGTLALSITNAATVGGAAADFIVDTAGMVATVAPGGSTTFTVAFSPGALGNRSTTLRVTSNDPGTPTFDVQLSGTGIDTLPPVINDPANLTVFKAGPIGTSVTYAPTATDNSGDAPTVDVVPASGSLFNLGTTTVNVTATDGSGNRSFASFTVTVVEPPHLEVRQPADTVLAGSPPTVAFGAHDLGVSTTKVFTLKNTGPGALTISGAAIVGGHSGDFTTDTAGMASSVAPGATTTLSVTFNPTAPGARASTLRIASNDPDQTAYDITVSGTGLDAIPPVIRPHLDRFAVATSAAGAVVHYGPARITDNSGIAPNVTYEPISGSLFPPGATTVAITATDSAGNVAASSFTVTVVRQPRLAVEVPTGTALLGTNIPVVWGKNSFGQSTVPDGLTGIIAVAAEGNVHTLALRSTGTVTGWGDDTFGKISGGTGVAGVIAISAGSSHTVALKNDGTVVVWGENTSHQRDVPSGLANVVAIATGALHSMALKDDGTVVVWGDNTAGQLVVPPDLSGVVAIAAAHFRCVALKSDGTVVEWGVHYIGSIPAPVGLTGVRSLSSSPNHNLALKADGTVVGWGSDNNGQISGLAGASGIRDLGAGFGYSLALKSDGTILASGIGSDGQVSGAAALHDVVDISAGQIIAAAVVRVAPVVAFGPRSVGSSITKTFTLRNTGLETLDLGGIHTSGGDAAEFTVDTAGVPSALPPDSSATFTVTYTPTTTDPRTTTLRVDSNDPDSAAFDITLNGFSTDTVAPVIAAHSDVSGVSTPPAGAVVTFAPATATDDSGDAPVITYSHASGSVFPPGTTTVTITATDASGNAATATFTVTVTLPPAVVAETGGTFAPDNLATGKTAFAKDVIGAAPHAIANVNDGLYGNPNSWIAGSADSFIGINLGATPITISQVAFGRDNTGSLGDRVEGSYTLQFTTVPDPDDATPDGSWTTLATTIENPGTLTSPALRHRYSFAPVQATGFRIKVQTTSLEICIDELELYDYDPVPHIAVEQPAGTSLSPTTASILFGSENLDTPGAPKTFTLKNTGTGPLSIASAATVGGAAADFIVDTPGMAATVAPGGSTTFTVAFSPGALGNRSTTLRVTSNDPGTPAFDVQLSGTGIDTLPPVIAVHANVSAERTMEAGAVVTYAPATATDNSGAAPVITYSHASGSVFPMGTTTVTITATDAHDNAATATFTVAVTEPPVLLETGGTFAPNNLALGKTAFAKDEISIAPHAIANVNDGVYGNEHSWIAGSGDSFIGINLGATPVSVSQVAFGRDNEGIQTSRAQGSYTIQYTTVPDPDATTPDSGWTTLASTIENPGTFTSPALRHRFSFPAVAATGIRIKTYTTGDEIGIDELEIYDPAPDIVVEQPTGTPLAPMTASVLFGSENLDTPGSPRTFTLKSTGALALSIASAATVGGAAADFIVDTAGMASPLAFGESTTFTVAFSPGALGDRSTTLRVTSNDPGTPAFDVQLSGTGIDTLPPVINTHADVSVVRTSAAGAVVTYAPATATDNSGAAPVIAYSHASGSVFPPGTTTVTITATDASGNAATATFTVTVTLPPAVVAETGGTFAPNNLALGKTAFAKDVIDVAPHAIAKVNDGLYGNANSWIAGSADSFIGINLGATPVSISQVAFGRDNTGSVGDRAGGTYILQSTTVSDPDASTPDGSWTTLATTIENPGSLTSPALRHRYSFAPVQATGFRIKVQTTSAEICIDELELYDYDPVPHIAVEQPVGTSLSPTTATILFGSENLNTQDAPKTFTLKNTGTGALSIASAATVGDNAADFIVGTYGMAASVAPGGSTTFTVAFSPGALGDRSTTLRVTSNDPGTPAFDIQLSGTGIDTLPPDIGAPKVYTVFATGPLGAVVNYDLEVTDNSGSDPTVMYVPPSGSFFLLGETTVNVSATDGSGNTSSESFTVTVVEPPHLEVRQPADDVLAGSPPTVDFGAKNQGASAAKVFTLKNTGPGTLTIYDAAIVGGHSGDFTVDTADMATSVAPGATTTLSVTFSPTAPGARASRLRISSNAPGQREYDITVSGIGVDNAPPVIRPHLDRVAVATSAAGAVVDYGPARITDNSGTAPTVTYHPISGSLFPPGATTVAITATDAAGNIATSSFTVTVVLRPRLAVEEPAGTAMLGTGVPVAWGDNTYGQSTVPTGLSGVIAVAAGQSKHTLALRADGTVTGWGHDVHGEVSGGAGLTGIVAISAGFEHSVALKQDGSVVAWGSNGADQLSVPGGLANVVSIATGEYHSMALRDDGTVAVWGSNDHGQLDVRPDLSGVVAIAAARYRCVALKSDGTVVEWGQPYSVEIPAPVGLSEVRGLVAGQIHNLALKADGTVVGWGNDALGPISGLVGATGIRALSAGWFYSLALKSDGTILAVGDDGAGRVSGAAPWQNVVAISAGIQHAAAVVRVAPVMAFGTRTVGSSTTKTFTLRNSGLGPLSLGGISTTGGNAAEFAVDTAGLPAGLPPNGSATFTVTFTPATTAPSTTTLRVASNDPGTPAFDITLNGNAADTLPPVLAAHADVDAIPTSAAGAVVNYAPATATDDSGAAPVITYSRASGSIFPRGTTTVTVTATDANGNASSGTFTVTVAAPLALVGTGGDFAPDNLATSGTAFAKDVINAFPHSIANVADATYGNANSWIAGSSDSFIGINLGATPVSLNRIAFGRDNDPGGLGDRVHGIYTVQFTTVPAPDASTPDSAWSSLGTLRYPGSIPSPSLRHLYAFPAVSATGVRIRVQSLGEAVCIDEIELYSAPTAAPVAAADSLLRPDTTRVAKFLQSALLANDTDADGDPLFLTAVGDALPAGATVRLAGNFVVYTAPATHAGNGSFTYTVDDGAGHTATATVTVTEASAPAVGASPPGAISASPSGADVVVTFIGVPGHGYRVQHTTSLAAPYVWQEFSPPAIYTAPAGGVFNHTDVAPGAGARFYRAIPNP